MRARSPQASDTSREEVEAYLATPVSASEREEVLTLVRWFRRRFSTGGERLAYVRRAYRRWSIGAQ